MRLLIEVVLGAEVVSELDGGVALVDNDALLLVASKIDVNKEQWLLLIILGVLFTFFGLFLLFNGLLCL